VITDGQTSAIQSVRQLQFARGTVVVIDRGYQDFGWWLELSRRKFLFVTQLKDNAEYGIVQQRRADPERDIQRDEVVVLTKLQEAGPVAHMRHIEMWIGPLADRTVLQGAAAVAVPEDLRGHQRQRGDDSDLDSIDCHAGGQVPATAQHLRLELVQSDRFTASPAVCLS